MRSGSEAGPYLRLIDSVYHSTLGLRVIKKKKKNLDGKHCQLLGISQRLGRHLDKPRASLGVGCTV